MHKKKVINDEVYSSERAELIKSAHYAADQLDKTLITLSTGSLYLSFYFVKDLKNITSECFLALGWFSFIISIISILLSFLFSEKAFSKQLDILNAKYKNKKAIEENKWNNWISYMQLLSLISLILGIIFLTRFYFLNI